MKCPKCQHENPSDALFCGKCGNKFSLICPQCNSENSPVNNFCNKCGHDLTQSESPQPEPLSKIQDPTSFADNRYQIKDVLGEGGKKKVYRAYDTLLDREVALALIKTEGLDENARSRITREAQAMGRVGTHPNIVTVFDLGEEDGQPFIVSEILGGGDVEGLIEKATGHRLDIDQVVDMAQSICEGLQFAHNKGIVHRDLKPSNVYLTDDGTVKIGDFGLALVDDRTRLTMEGMMVGTVSYMAPEQATGGEVTPQSDLYSLGAMLYEMTTGRPPFVGDDHVAIIGQHINTPPVSPSWHNKDIPASLEKLILSLLEKNPGDRPTSASNVIQTLELIKQGEVSEDIVIEPTEADKRAPVYRQVFVGRENELKQLKTAFNNALSGQGSLVMVVGEPGIGKTAITQQLATYVTMRSGLTLLGHCYEEGSLSLPYLAFVEAMRTYVLNREETDLRRVMGTGASEVARIVSEVRDKLQVEPSPPTNPDEDRYRLFQAVTDFLSNASEVQPLLIVLEDLHDADKGTLDLLVYVARRMSKGRFLMVGTYRDVEVDRTHPLANTLAELRRVSSYERVLLRGLTIDEVQRMLSGLSGQNTPWEIAETVHRQTEGNPLFIQEVIRYVVEEGLLVRESGEWRAVDPNRLMTSIPEGLRDVIGKRLSNLSKKCGQVLSIASVMGREFRFEVLQNVSDMPEEDLFSALQEAIAAAVIEERTLTAAAVMYRFTHAFIRQALYEEMIAPRRNRLHIQIAHALEEVFANRLPEHAVELFDHFSHSTNPDDLSKAVFYGEMAAERAIAVFDYGETVRLLDQTLQVQEVLNPEDKNKLCDLRLDLCDALLAINTKRVLETEASLALTLAEAINDENRAVRACHAALTAIFMELGGPGWGTPEAIEWAQRADHYAKPDTIERAIVDMAFGATLWITGHRRSGLKRLDQSMNLARKLGDPNTMWIAGYGLLLFRLAPQYVSENICLVEELMELSDAGVNFVAAGTVKILAISTYLNLGRRVTAEKFCDELRAMSERSGQSAWWFASTPMDALLMLMDGRLEEVLYVGQEVRSRGKEAGVDQMAGIQAGIIDFRARIYLGSSLELIERRQAAIVDSENRNHALHCTVLAHLGWREKTSKILESQVVKRPSVGTDEDESPIYMDALYLESAVLTGHRSAAKLLLHRFSETGVFTSGIWFPTCIPRHMGGAAALLDQYDEARQHYQEAIRICNEMPFRPELALSRFQLAELMFEHFPDEKEEAIEHLNFAIDEFKEMKMQPSLEKAENLKASIG